MPPDRTGAYLRTAVAEQRFWNDLWNDSGVASTPRRMVILVVPVPRKWNARDAAEPWSPPDAEIAHRVLERRRAQLVRRRSVAGGLPVGTSIAGKGPRPR